MLKHNLKLFGYNNLFKHLVKLVNNNQIPSRILFTGQEGIGKSVFAFHLVNYILSKHEVDNYDVNENKLNNDSSCLKLIKNLSHPNFYLISKNTEKKNIDIEQIRSLFNFLNKSSFDNEKKIILIDGAEDLNSSSSNALLKNLEESSEQNLFILTHNINRKLPDTIKSRCIPFKLNLNYSFSKQIVNEYFGSNLYEEINEDFKSIILSPKFLINHISFIRENNLDIKLINVESIMRYIIDNKSYKKNEFISKNFQNYIEVFFTKIYSNTRDFRHYDNFLSIVAENNLIRKFNLDLDSFFIKFENKYLNI